MAKRRHVLKPESNLEDIFLMWYRNRAALGAEPTQVVDYLKDYETMVTCSFEKHANALHLDPDSDTTVSTWTSLGEGLTFDRQEILGLLSKPTCWRFRLIVCRLRGS